MDAIAKTFVTVCVFLTMVAVLVSGAYSIIGDSELANNAQNAIATEKMHNTFNPSQFAQIAQTYILLPPTVEAVENMSYGSFWYPNTFGAAIWDGDGAGVLTFDDDSDINVYLIVETVVDPIFHTVTHPVKMYFHQVWGGFLGLFISQAYVEMDVDRVVGNLRDDGISYTDVVLKQGYTIIITPDAGTDLETDWNAHAQFSISVGQTINNATALNSGDVLSIIGQVMTFSVPNVPLVNMILAAVLIPTYTIIFVIIVRSFIPFLP